MVKLTEILMFQKTYDIFPLVQHNRIRRAVSELVMGGGGGGSQIVLGDGVLAEFCSIVLLGSL